MINCTFGAVNLLSVSIARLDTKVACVRVIGRQYYLSLVYATLIYTTVWAGYEGGPYVWVVVRLRRERDVSQVLLLEVGNLAVYAFESGLTHIIRDD